MCGDLGERLAEAADTREKLVMFKHAMSMIVVDMMDAEKANSDGDEDDHGQNLGSWACLAHTRSGL